MMTCAQVLWISLTVIAVLAVIVNHIIWERNFNRSCNESKQFFLDMIKK